MKATAFIYKGRTYYLNADRSAEFHIRNSTKKIAKMAELVGRDCRVVFDVGANCGLFTAFASSKNPECVFYAFEASPDLIPFINRNCDSDNVHIHQNAISEFTGKVNFYVNPNSQQTNSLNEEAVRLFIDCNAPADLITLEVSSISINDFCEKNNIKQVDALKIDVQGAEGQVLKGASTIIDTVRYLFIESTWMEISSIIDLVPWALNHGFLYLNVLNPVHLGADILLTRKEILSDLVIKSYHLDKNFQDRWS